MILHSDPEPVRKAKRAMRAVMRARRGGDDASLVAALLRAHLWRRGERIGGVWPLPGEPDLRPLWRMLHGRGHSVLLPETMPPGEPLRFRPWSPECEMIDGLFGTQHPAADPVDAAWAPELMFVPLLAFDRELFRLGYGGGYYDRTLAAVPGARTLGYGYAWQQVEAVPRGPFDLPLDEVVTEHGPVAHER